MPVPLYGFLQGDTVGLLILADEGDTLEALAQKLQAAASLRVAARDPVTVAQAGFEALDRFDVLSG